MDTIEKLKWLIENCEYSVTIWANDHRDCYVPIEEDIADINSHGGEDISQELAKEMIEKNSLIRVRAYPDSPGSFYVGYHWDLDKAIDQVYQIVKRNQKD